MLKWVHRWGRNEWPISLSKPTLDKLKLVHYWSQHQPIKKTSFKCTSCVNQRPKNHDDQRPWRQNTTQKQYCFVGLAKQWRKDIEFLWVKLWFGSVIIGKPNMKNKILHVCRTWVTIHVQILHKHATWYITWCGHDEPCYMDDYRRHNGVVRMLSFHKSGWCHVWAIPNSLHGASSDVIRWPPESSCGWT